MSKVIASITTSVDGYVTGPDDGPEYGLGRGGERLHYWVMGGPWTYEGGHDFGMHGPDKQFYDELVSTMASAVVGRGMYDAAGAWGGTNPFPGTLFVLTHRTEDQPAEETGFRASTWTSLGFLQAAPGVMSQYFDVYLASDLEAGVPSREASEQDMRQKWVSVTDFERVSKLISRFLKRPSTDSSKNSRSMAQLK